MDNQPFPQAATSDAEFGVLSASTDQVPTLEGTPLGDEEPEGFHRSDTEPPTDPSVEREVPEEAEREDSDQAAKHTGANDQGAGDSGEPEEGGLPTQNVFKMLEGVGQILKAREEPLDAQGIHISPGSLLLQPDNPYGDGYSTEVQAPTLNHTLIPAALTPSAPPECSTNQAFQKEPMAQPQEPKASLDGKREDQRVQSGLDQRELRAK